MNTVKPITLCELKEKASKVKLNSAIINTINNKLLYNAENYGFIGADIPFKALFKDYNIDFNNALVSKLKLIYNEYTISNCSSIIYIKEKEEYVYI